MDYGIHLDIWRWDRKEWTDEIKEGFDVAKELGANTVAIPISWKEMDENNFYKLDYVSDLSEELDVGLYVRWAGSNWCGRSIVSPGTPGEVEIIPPRFFIDDCLVKYGGKVLPTLNPSLVHDDEMKCFIKMCDNLPVGRTKYIQIFNEARSHNPLDLNKPMNISFNNNLMLEISERANGLNSVAGNYCKTIMNMVGFDKENAELFTNIIKMDYIGSDVYLNAKGLWFFKTLNYWSYLRYLENTNKVNKNLNGGIYLSETGTDKDSYPYDNFSNLENLELLLFWSLDRTMPNPRFESIYKNRQITESGYEIKRLFLHFKENEK